QGSLLRKTDATQKAVSNSCNGKPCCKYIVSAICSRKPVYINNNTKLVRLLTKDTGKAGFACAIHTSNNSIRFHHLFLLRLFPHHYITIPCLAISKFQIRP